MLGLVLLLATTPAFAPADADLRCATNRWLLFEKRETLPSQRIIRPHRVRYYLQRLGEKKATLVLDTTTYHPPHIATVLDDGTILAHNRATELYRLPWTGKPVKELPPATSLVDAKGIRHWLLGAYADGVVVQPRMKQGIEPVYWVPFRDGKLAWKPRVLLTEKKGISNSTPFPFIRHNNRFAFGRSTVDLKSGHGGSVKGDITPWIRAYNGTHVADGSRVVELKSGRMVPLPYAHQVFAIRGRTAFGLRMQSGPEPSQVFALDLESGKLTVRFAWKTPRISTRRFRVNQRNVVAYHHRDHPVRVFWNREGITVWADGQWKHLAFELPE